MIDLRPPFDSTVAEQGSTEVALLRRDCLSAPIASAGRRARSAERLARLAFVERDRQAWESVQSVIWQLMRREKFRPVHPSDVEVLDIVFGAEESSIKTPAVSSSLSIHEFCDKLDHDLASIFSKGRFDESLLETFQAEDWRFVLYNFVPSGWDFVRIIALTAVMLPIELAVPLYENLYDESGRGGRQMPHRILFGRMMEALGANVPNLDRHSIAELRFLDLVVPEAIAELNLWSRMLWSRNPGGAIGALYSVEASVPSYFAPLERQLRRLNLNDAALEYITGHMETDVEHASQWRELVKTLLTINPNERAAIYQGALLSASWDVLAWQTVIQSWHAWKAGRPISNIGASIEPMPLARKHPARQDTGTQPALG
jgi:pyrroloquinoline quinone (PQQ) biosynthesis protein C